LNSNASFFGDLFGTNNNHPEIVEDSSEVIVEEVPMAPHIDDSEELSVEDAFSKSEESLEPEIVEEPIYMPTPKAFDEEEEFIDDESIESDFVRSKTIFVSYIQKPEKIYLSQHITIKVKAIVTDNSLNKIKTVFVNKKDVKILNKISPWKKVSDTVYENSYVYKLFSTAAKLPDIKVVAHSRDRMKTETLRAFKPTIIALREDTEFCQVLSNDFTIKTHQEKKYDEKSNIIVMEINATDSNLEDFHIPYALKDGIDRINSNKNSQNIYYFAVLPNDIKKFKFKYFDLVSNKYNIVSFPIKPIDSSISTQTDLNPQKNRYILYKAIAIFTVGLIIFLLYLKTKQLYLLLISLIIFAYVTYTQIPISKATLQKGVELKILPTENSTIFYKVEKEVKADILLKKDGYIKVLLPNKKIGWIKQ
jgi:hypothetical protein